jgi:hypothetical protein
LLDQQKRSSARVVFRFKFFYKTRSSSSSSPRLALSLPRRAASKFLRSYQTSRLGKHKSNLAKLFGIRSMYRINIAKTIRHNIISDSLLRRFGILDSQQLPPHPNSFVGLATSHACP